MILIDEKGVRIVKEGGMITTYTKRPSLSAEVLGPYASEGFDIIEKGDDETILAYNGEIVATYYQTNKANDKAEIRKACQEYLEKKEVFLACNDWPRTHHEGIARINNKHRELTRREGK